MTKKTKMTDDRKAAGKRTTNLWTPRRSRPWEPTLSFTPEAWIKLQFLCHLGETEVGGFGVVPDPHEFLVTELVVVKQRCTAVSVRFDDEAVADYFEAMVDRGFRPGQFARVWLHSHPGNSAQPSSVDEETFARVFGRCDWAVMFVLAHNGETYARLRFAAGPGGEMLLPVAVRWDLPLGHIDQDGWQDEYDANVIAEPLRWDSGTRQEGVSLGQVDGLEIDAQGRMADGYDDLIIPTSETENEYDFIY